MKPIKSVSGIRGILNKTLFLDDITSYVLSFSKIQKQKKLPLLIARDSRTTGKQISSHIINVLTKNGRDIIDCNIIPTPTAQIVTDKFNIAGGIVITASHNPSEWNGLKFINSNGIFLDKKINAKLFKYAENNSHNFIKINPKVGNVSSYKESIDFHIDNILNISFINVPKIRDRKFKIVLDTINGASCFGFYELLKKLNCEIIHINDKPNGIFKRNPEPKTENIRDLTNIVLKNNADLGFVTDPDGDRLAVIDNKGDIMIEENTLVLCVDEFLSKTKKNYPIVTNLSTTAAVEDITKKYGVNVVRSAVGEINVVNKMKELNGMIGGEGNGGIILAESHYGRDAFIGAVIILNHLATNDMTMNETQIKIPKYYMLKEKIKIKSELTKPKIHKKIKESFEGLSFDETDGIKVIHSNFWIHIRQSNTEPIIRIYIESKLKNDLKNLFSKVNEIFN